MSRATAQEMQRKINLLTEERKTLNEVSALLNRERDEAICAARSMQEEVVALKSQQDALTAQLRILSTKERGWPWALEQLAAGHKVTHPILSSDPERPGWIEKLGSGPRGTLYEIHESYTYMRVMESEDLWVSMTNKARQSIGWAVLK